MLTKENLEEKGFVFESEENGIFQRFVKQIDENVELVLEGSPEKRLFVYLWEDEEKKHDDGVVVLLNTDDIDLAIQCAGIIAGVE